MQHDQDMWTTDAIIKLIRIASSVDVHNAEATAQHVLEIMETISDTWNKTLSSKAVSTSHVVSSRKACKGLTLTNTVHMETY